MCILKPGYACLDAYPTEHGSTTASNGNRRSYSSGVFFGSVLGFQVQRVLSRLRARFRTDLCLLYYPIPGDVQPEGSRLIAGRRTVRNWDGKERCVPRPPILKSLDQRESLGFPKHGL